MFPADDARIREISTQAIIVVVWWHIFQVECTPFFERQDDEAIFRILSQGHLPVLDFFEQFAECSNNSGFTLAWPAAKNALSSWIHVTQATPKPHLIGNIGRIHPIKPDEPHVVLS